MSVPFTISIMESELTAAAAFVVEVAAEAEPIAIVLLETPGPAYLVQKPTRSLL